MNGAYTITLTDSQDFQALPFYQKHGYTVFGVLENMPIGYTRYSMQKELHPDRA